MDAARPAKDLNRSLTSPLRNPAAAQVASPSRSLKPLPVPQALPPDYSSQPAQRHIQETAEGPPSHATRPSTGVAFDTEAENVRSAVAPGDVLPVFRGGTP